MQETGYPSDETLSQDPDFTQWLELGKTDKPDLVVHIGGGRMTSKFKDVQDAGEFAEGGRYADARYLTVDPDLSPLVQSILKREAIGYGIKARVEASDKVRQLHGQATEVWIDNLGNLKEKEELFAEVERLLAENGEVFIYDSFTQDFGRDERGNRMRSLTPLVDFFMELGFEATFMDELQESEETKLRENPFIAVCSSSKYRFPSDDPLIIRLKKLPATSESESEQ